MFIQLSHYDMLYRRNSQADVVRLHRLPNEVLSNIMRVGLDQSSDEPARAQWLVTVSSICALWRQIALRTPCLWTRVAFYLEEDTDEPADAEADAYFERRIRRDLDMAEAFFRRSGALKLHLIIDWSSINSLPRGIAQFVSLLTANSHRIGSLAFRGQCAPDLLPGLEAPLPSSLPNLASLELHTEIVDIGADGVPHVFPTFLHLSDAESGNIRIDYASPWNINTIRAPRLKQLSYRAYVPTRAFAEFVGRCEHLEKLTLSFDTIPDGDRRENTIIESSSVKQLTITGDMWALDATLGPFPRLEHLSTAPHGLVSNDPSFLTLRHVDGGRRTLSFPSLRTLGLRPWHAYDDEDLDFILAQPKLQELDLRDVHFPSDILAALIVPDPPQPSLTGGPSPTPSTPMSNKSRSSRSPPLPPLSPSTPPPFPNPALNILRLHRSRSSESTEEEWRQMTSLAQTLLAQRPSLVVHFVGGGDYYDFGVDARTQSVTPVLHCEPTLFVMSTMFGGRVRITSGENEDAICC